MHIRRRFAALCLTLTMLYLGAQHAPAAGKNPKTTVTPTQGWCGRFDVMTRNLYLGTDFSEVFSAQDPQTLLAEVAEAFADVQASDPQARIEAVAHEIRTTKPDLVGLQEVALWQTGAFLDPAPSADTAYDFLQLLLDELNNKGGVHYEPVSVLTNLVAEAPAAGPGGLFDVRFTDRVVLLARTDLKRKQFSVENVVAQHFSTLLSIPSPALGLITVPRGYIAADVERCGQSFRFLTAHLESFEEALGLPFPFFRFAQATELLQGPAGVGQPVVLAGDFNADAEDPADPTYQLLLGAGFADAWEATNPGDPGYTWPLFLVNPFEYVTPSQRLDLVLTRGGVEATKAELTGERDVTPQRLLPSDHAGVAATLRLLP